MRKDEEKEKMSEVTGKMREKMLALMPEKMMAWMPEKKMALKQAKRKLLNLPKIADEKMTTKTNHPKALGLRRLSV